jgi:hypothetical protein
MKVIILIVSTVVVLAVSGCGQTAPGYQAAAAQRLQ